MNSPLQSVPLERIDSTPTTLASYASKVLLIVNVASRCGLTPQYNGLEALYRKHQAAGLVVLGFPCNDFSAQEPGSEADIQTFCTREFDVSFPMFSKVRINSAPRHPLYARLISEQPAATPAPDGPLRQKLASYNLLPQHDSDVLWNFEKFLVDRQGRAIARFAPDVTPDSPLLDAAILSALVQ